MNQNDRIRQLERYSRELEQQNERLRQENDRLRQAEAKSRQTPLLSTVAQVANLLLRSQDYTTVLPDVVRLLGKAVGSDRCAFVRSTIETDSGRILYQILSEWSHESTLNSLTTSFDHELVNDDYLVMEGDLLSLHRQLEQGEIVNYLADELPEAFRHLCELQGTTSGLVVPIFVQAVFWGHVYFDNCGEPRLYDEAEIAVLRIAADSIAAAIERQAKDEELQAAQQERNRLLSTVAQVANLLLRSQDYTTVLPDVVRLLGEAVGSDRCGIGQMILHPASGKPALSILPEWCKSEVLTSGEFSPHSDYLYWEEDIPYVYATLAQGYVINSLVADLPEPERGLLAAQGNKAELFVPILIGQQLWGYIAFDNRNEPRLYDEAEIAILQVAADSIAAAIERQAKDEELRKSEALYRSLFEISSEGIWRWALDQPLSLDLSVEQQLEQYYESVHFVQGNTAFAQMYGLAKAKDCEGRRLKDVHLANSEKNLAFIRTLIENDHQIRNAESEEIDVHGKKRYFLNSIASLIENNCVIGGWGTQIDITELRETQQALLQVEQERSQQLERLNAELQQTLDRLSESEERYRTLFEISSEGIWRFEHNPPISTTLPIDEQVEQIYRSYSIVEANATFAEMYGFEKLEDVIGFRIVSSHVEESERNHAMMRSVVENGHKIRNAETEEIDRYGNPRYFLNNITTIIKDGYAIGGWASQLDITELRLAQQALLQAEQERSQQLERLNAELQQTLDRLSESEERYRTLFEISSEGIYRFEYIQPISIHESVDQQVESICHSLRVAEGNATYAEMYGFDAPEEIVGLRIPQAHVGNSTQNREFLQALVEQQHQIRNYESEEIDRYGNPRYFLNNITTIIKDGYAIGGWASQLDITELRLAQQALLQAEQDRVAELAKTNQALKNSLDRLAAEPDLNSFLGYVLLEITQQLNLDVATLWLYDSASQTLPIELEIKQGQITFKHEIQAPEAYLHPSITSTPVWNLLLQAKQPVVVNRENGQEYCFQGTYDHQAHQLELQVSVNLLLMLGDEPIGLLGLASTQRTSFTPEELELAQALAQQATLAIQLTRLAEEAKQAAIVREQEKAAQERIIELAKTNQALKNSLDALAQRPELSAFIESVLREIVVQLDASLGAYFQFSPDRNTLMLELFYNEQGLVDWQNLPDMELFKAAFDADSTAFWQELVSRRQPITFDCTQSSNLSLSGTEAWHRQQGHTRVLCTLLLSGDEPLGFLGFGFKSGSAFAAQELELAQALAHQATLAIQLTRLAEEAKQVAIFQERSYIATEVHDTLAQDFAGVSMQLQAFNALSPLDPDRAQVHLDRAQDLCKRGLVEARRSVWCLQQDSDRYSQLLDLIQHYIDQLNIGSSVPIRCETQGNPYPINPESGRHLLRIVQESLANAVRHAQAEAIQVQVNYAVGEIAIAIQDNGCGFDPEAVIAKGFGLDGMRQRASLIGAQFSIQTQLHQGTIVKVMLAIA